MKIFESALTDTTFPRQAFIVMLVLNIITATCWWLTREKLHLETLPVAYAIAFVFGFLPAKMIQHLKEIGSRPPIIVSENGLQIRSGVGFGTLHVPWQSVQEIRTAEVVDSHRLQPYATLEIEIAETRSATIETTTIKKIIWKIIAACGGSRKHRIIGENLAEGLDELIKSIEVYYRVTKHV